MQYMNAELEQIPHSQDEAPEQSTVTCQCCPDYRLCLLGFSTCFYIPTFQRSDHNKWLSNWNMYLVIYLYLFIALECDRKKSPALLS